MIIIFGQTDTSFESNGDIVIQPLKAKVHKEDNGEYYLDLEAGLDYIDYLVPGNIVVANTPQGYQGFRVCNPTKTKNKIISKCYHVFYDTQNYLIANSNVVDKTCNDALAQLNNATEPQSEFQTISDVGTVNSFLCERQSLYQAIQTVLEKWGGHLVRDNFNIEIRNAIGHDNGITVQYKKNLKDISCEENWNNVVTKLLPVGKDGILLNAIDPSASIYVESVQQYNLPYTKTVSFSQDDIQEEDYETQQAYKQALVEDLRLQATEYIEKNSVPQINYTLKANLEKITDVGDTIEVIDERLGIDIMTNVIAFDYDCLLEKYTEIEFGNFRNTLSGLVSNITTSVTKAVDDMVQGISDANAITVALNDNVTNLTANTYTKIPFNTANVIGTKLTVTNDGGIKIGENISKILVSGRASIQSSVTDGQRQIIITKNSNTDNNTFGCAGDNFGTSTTKDISITPIIANVTPGDIVYMWYHVPSGADVLEGNTSGSRTSITIEILK